MGGSVGTIYGYEYEIFIQKQNIKQNLIDISCPPPPPPPLPPPPKTTKHNEIQTPTPRTHALLGRKKKRRDTPYYFNQSPTRHTRNRFKMYMRAKFNHNYTMPE